MPPAPSVGTTIISLLDKHHLLTAPELLTLLQSTRPGINKTSVYRALDKLLLEGKICRQHLNNNHIVYELRSHHHDHLVCSSCGTVTTAECQVQVAEVKDFKVDHHHLTLYGQCAKCQNKSAGTYE